jgi:hypothetical protein
MKDNRTMSDTGNSNQEKKLSVGETGFWEWFGSTWYLFLFPAFVFSAGIRLGLTSCNPGTIGFALAVAFAYVVKQAEIASIKQVAAVTLVVPLVFLAIALLISAGEMSNPYLDTTARLGRAFISAVFSVLLLLGSVGLTKLTRR